jgi:hypothetical protein
MLVVVALLVFVFFYYQPAVKITEAPANIIKPFVETIDDPIILELLNVSGDDLESILEDIDETTLNPLMEANTRIKEILWTIQLSSK